MFETVIDWVNSAILGRFSMPEQTIGAQCECGHEFDIRRSALDRTVTCPACSEPLSLDNEREAALEMLDFSQSPKLFLFGSAQGAAALLLWLFIFMELNYPTADAGMHLKGLVMLFSIASVLTGLSFSSFKRAIRGTTFEERN